MNTFFIICVALSCLLQLHSAKQVKSSDDASKLDGGRCYSDADCDRNRYCSSYGYCHDRSRTRSILEAVPLAPVVPSGALNSLPNNEGLDADRCYSDADCDRNRYCSSYGYCHNRNRTKK